MDTGKDSYSSISCQEISGKDIIYWFGDRDIDGDTAEVGII
jgi:hypothetical protein